MHIYTSYIHLEIYASMHLEQLCPTQVAYCAKNYTAIFTMAAH